MLCDNTSITSNIHPLATRWTGLSLGIPMEICIHGDHSRFMTVRLVTWRKGRASCKLTSPKLTNPCLLATEFATCTPPSIWTAHWREKCCCSSAMQITVTVTIITSRNNVRQLLTVPTSAPRAAEQNINFIFRSQHCLKLCHVKYLSMTMGNC